MILTKQKKIIFASAGFVLLLAVIVVIVKINRASGVYKVKRDKFEAIISTKGEIQSEKAVLITLPDIIGDRKLEIWDCQIKDLIPEGSIVKKGDYVAQLDQGRIKQLKENKRKPPDEV